MEIKEKVVNQKKNPELRFQEFQEDWKRLPMAEVIAKISSGKTKPQRNGIYPVYGSTGIIGRSKKFTHNGEFILIARVGANAGTINRIKDKFSVTDNTLILITDENYLIPGFAEAFLRNFNLNKLIFGSGQPLITGGLIKNIKLSFPLVSEQQKIATFLSAVDKKIQLLTGKKELLETYKKGVMQQLFTQEIRFKPVISEAERDENEFPKWEEKKLGEIATFSKGKGISKDDILEDGLNPCIRYGQLYTTYKETIEHTISKTNVAKENLVLSKAGDVIIPASGETQIDIATASCVLKEGIALGGDLNIIRGEFNGVFIAYYLNSHLKTQIARLSQGSSVIHLYSKQLSKLKMSFPIAEEQQKIADFLSAIDRKTEAVQQQMFV